MTGNDYRATSGVITRIQHPGEKYLPDVIVDCRYAAL